MIFSWSSQRSFDVNRLQSHFCTFYFYGLSGSSWRRARLFDCGARYLLLQAHMAPRLLLRLWSAEWGRLEDNQPSLNLTNHHLSNINARISWSPYPGGYFAVRFRWVLCYQWGCSLPSNCPIPVPDCLLHLLVFLKLRLLSATSFVSFLWRTCALSFICFLL